MTTTATTNTTFLGWDKPFPAAVAAHLIRHWPEMSFVDVTVVTPGGRAGRRILSLLADFAAEKGLVMLPPEFITLGQLPEQLCRSSLPLAGAFIRQVAWVAALHRTSAESLRPLFPRLLATDAPGVWNGAAAILERSHIELSAGMIRLADVLDKSRNENGLGNPERWETATKLHASYLSILRSMGFCDQQQDRIEALGKNAPDTCKTFILAGVVELGQQAEALLKRVRMHIHPLIYAPPEHADGFDDLGCVRTEYWATRPIDLTTTNLRVADKIYDQAEAVFTEMAGLGTKIRSDEITIGVTDESIVPHIEATAVNLDGVPVRYGAGILLSRTRPFQLLDVVAEYLQSAEYRHFSILVRHPDIEKYLRADPDKPGVAGMDWRPMLDRYAADYLPAALGPECREPQGWRWQSSGEHPGPDDRAELAWLYGQVETLIGELRRPELSPETTADEWAEPILALLRRIYGGQWDQRDDRQRLVVLACQSLRAELGELREAGEVAERSAFQTINAHEAIRGLLGLCSSRRLAPPQVGNEIEIVGWLELMPDDAAHLIVTGFNEGRVPESSRVDPLINETVREALGLVCDRDRLARDAYLLTAMVQSRPPGSVTLISGRKSAQSDPLLPSRLLFACDVKLMAQRVLKMTEDPPRRAPLALRFAPSQNSGFKIGATVPGLVSPVTKMRVTSFRDYLGSPRGFYLKHVLGLSTLEESAPRELDPRQYGTIVHQILRSFAETPAAQSDNPQKCRETLNHLLHTLVAEKFGDSLSGAMKFQIEMIRRRLENVADKQADWFAKGWRIKHTEWQPASAAALEVDGYTMGLSGRIDRIDYHERDGNFAILDYKIVTGRKTPESTHQSAGQWTDLQLPLYRHLAREIIGDKVPRLGYFVISDSQANTGHRIAEWDDGALDAADDIARQVVRDVRASRFDEIGENPPIDGIFAHIFGQGVLALDAEDEPEEEIT